jgi:hypothetical protein
MRIWSIHPKYLDVKGLVALWREALLAKHVLEGKTKGYKHHPQLERFKKTDRPLDCINQYLLIVYQEATDRGYHFNRDKINLNFQPSKISLSTGQLKFESTHLLNKLKTRDTQKYKEFSEINEFEAHPLFVLVDGEIEYWEKNLK